MIELGHTPILFTYMAQRDDAEDERERAYWQGYLDAAAYYERVNLSALEEAYDRMHNGKVLK